MSDVFSPSALVSGAAWVAGCRIVGILATLAANILVARLLGPAEFGTYVLATTCVWLGSLVGMAGLNEAGLRFISESLALDRPGVARAYVRRVLRGVGRVSLVSAVVVAAALGGFQWFTGRIPEPQLVAGLVALGIVALAWQQVAAESLRAYGDLRLASLFSGGQSGGPLSNLLFLAGLGVAAALSARIDAALALGAGVASVCLTAPLVLGTLWRTAGPARHGRAVAPAGAEWLSSRQEQELRAVGGMLLLNQLLAFAGQQSDIWLGGVLLSPVDLGLYGAAKRILLLAAMPVQMAMMAVVSAVPRLHAQGRTRELERLLRTAATAAAAPALLALMLLAVCPGTVLRLVFGRAYAAAAPAVWVLLFGHLVLVLSGNPPHVLAMTGRHRTVVGVNLVAAMMLIVGGAAGARRWGPAGLAAGSAASLALQNVALWWLAHRQLGLWTHVRWPIPWGSEQRPGSAGSVAAVSGRSEQRLEAPCRNKTTNSRAGHSERSEESSVNSRRDPSLRSG